MGTYVFIQNNNQFCFRTELLFFDTQWLILFNSKRSVALLSGYCSYHSIVHKNVRRSIVFRNISLNFTADVELHDHISRSM